MTSASADPFTAGQQAWIKESVANLQRLAKMPMLWQRAQRVKKGATPSEVIYEADRVKLGKGAGKRVRVTRAAADQPVHQSRYG